MNDSLKRIPLIFNVHIAYPTSDRRSTWVIRTALVTAFSSLQAEQRVKSLSPELFGNFNDEECWIETDSELGCAVFYGYNFKNIESLTADEYLSWLEVRTNRRCKVTNSPLPALIRPFVF